MSYSFGMFFAECKPEDVLDKCLMIAKKVASEPQEFINENEFYLPSRKYEYEIDKNILRQFDRIWLYGLFNFRFVYWEKYGLLGLSGYHYNKAAQAEFTNHVCFQNSCDQNYDYSEWYGISCFDRVVSEVAAMDMPQLLEGYPDYSEEELRSDILYYKQSLVYHRIFEMLDLKRWLYGEDGDFKRITINGIDSQETLMDLTRYLP